MHFPCRIPFPSRISTVVNLSRLNSFKRAKAASFGGLVNSSPYHFTSISYYVLQLYVFLKVRRSDMPFRCRSRPERTEERRTDFSHCECSFMQLQGPITTNLCIVCSPSPLGLHELTRFV